MPSPAELKLSLSLASDSAVSTWLEEVNRKSCLVAVCCEELHLMGEQVVEAQLWARRADWACVAVDSEG